MILLRYAFMAAAMMAGSLALSSVLIVPAFAQHVSAGSARFSAPSIILSLGVRTHNTGFGHAHAVGKNFVDCKKQKTGRYRCEKTPDGQN